MRSGAVEIGRRALALVALLCAAGSSARAQVARDGTTGNGAQPGDRLSVRLLNDPSISETLVVDDKGSVVLPLIGVRNVSDIPLGQLPDSIRSMYGKLLRQPAVEVVVLRRIVVNGEVRRPDVYYMDVTTTSLRDVIAHAGGFTDAATGSVQIIRNGEVIPVPDWERKPPAEGDLRSGDQVFVPRRSWIAMNILGTVSTAAVVASILFTILRR